MRTPRLLLLFAAVTGIAAAWGVLELTEPPGPGFDPDSLSYLGAGISLARGEGLRVPSAVWASVDTTTPLVHFPPGFSAAIAAGIGLGATPVNAARLVEAVAACAIAMAVFLSVASAGGLLGALVAVAIAAATPAMVTVHASVLSEPLFLALLACFTGVLATERTARGTRRTLLLGALAAAATLVRYAGVSLVLALALDAFFSSIGVARAGDTSGARWRARLRHTAFATALPLIAIGAWVLTRPSASDAERIRVMGLYFRGSGATLAEGTATVGRWLAPSVAPGTAMVFVALAVLAAIAALLLHASLAAQRGEATASEVRLVRAAEAVALCYVLVVVASRVLVDPGIPFDDRLLAPVFLLASLAIGVTLASWCRSSMRARRQRALLFTVGLTASWVAGATQVSARLVQEFRADGADMASSAWRLSPLVDWAAHADASTRLYSNWPAPIWLHTGRAAFELPERLDSGTVAAFRTKLARERGAVLAFREVSPDAAPPDSLAKLGGLMEVAHWPDGTVWQSGATGLAGVAGVAGGATGALLSAVRKIRP